VHVERWTGGTAQGYRPCMYKPTLLIPLMFILVDGVRCKDDEPTGAQFGEACGDVECAEGLKCASGFCSQLCDDDTKCEPIDGFSHECFPDGLCRIRCEAKTLACPSNLDTPMKCGVGFCESAL